jgi:hypothetical protein
MVEDQQLVLIELGDGGLSPSSRRATCSLWTRSVLRMNSTRPIESRGLFLFRGSKKARRLMRRRESVQMKMLNPSEIPRNAGWFLGASWLFSGNMRFWSPCPVQRRDGPAPRNPLGVICVWIPLRPTFAGTVIARGVFLLLLRDNREANDRQRRRTLRTPVKKGAWTLNSLRLAGCYLRDPAG